MDKLVSKVTMKKQVSSVASAKHVAISLSVYCLLVFCAFQAYTQDQPKGKIVGRITVDGKPVARLSVRLIQRTTREIRTASDGRFEFGNLEPGTYVLEVRAEGYYPEFDNGERFSRRVEVRANQPTVSIDARLVLGGVLAGRVVDQSGLPLTGVVVEASKVDNPPVYNPFNVETDDQGDFRILGLPPGRYLVGVNINHSFSFGRLVPSYPTTFYPGVHERSQAQEISLAPSAVVEDLILSLDAPEETRNISGKVLDPDSREPFPHVWIYIANPEGEFLGSGPEFGTSRDGSFQIHVSHPGTWRLQPMSRRGSDEAPVIGDPVTIQVGDSDITGLVLQARRAMTVEGEIHSLDPTLPVTGASIFLKVTDDPRDWIRGRISSDGHFRISPAPEGDYQLDLSLPDAAHFVQSITREGADMLGVPLKIRAGISMNNIRVVIASGAASVAGEVELSRPLIAGTVMMVVAVALDASTQSVRHWGFSNQVGPDRRFLIRGLAPDEYLVVPVVIKQGMRLSIGSLFPSGLPSGTRVKLEQGQHSELTVRYSEQ